MRLLIKLTNQLNKAGREGLVPVERQVIRGGKSFRQIFYVRPSRAESEKEAEKVQDPETFHTPPLKGGFPDNRPQGGFWIALHKEGEDVAVRIPQKHMDRVFNWAGHSFVVHRFLNFQDKRWGAQYTVSETTTGLSIGSEKNVDPERAWKLGMQQLEKVGKQKLDDAIKSSANKLDKVPEENYYGITDHWDAAEIVTPEAINQLVNHLVHFADEAVSRSQIEDWLKKHYTFTETSDIDDLKEEIGDQWALEQAIIYDKSYDDAFEEVKAIADMMDVAEVDDPMEIQDWAEKHGYDLGRYVREDWEVDADNGAHAEPKEVMQYAFEHDVGMNTAWDIFDKQFKEEADEDYGAEARDRAEVSRHDIPEKGDRRDYQDFDPAKRESLLTNNTEAERANLGGGVNGSYWIRLENGDDIEGVWKPQHEEYGGLRSNISKGTYYLREAAAWEVDKAMDLGLVPPTVIQQVDGLWGSVQEFMGDAYTPSESSIESPDDMYAASVFDFLTLNTDRHSNNYMITTDGRPILIDNGLILPTDEDRLGNAFYNSNFYRDGSVPAGIMEKVRNADWSKVVNWMVDHGIEDSAVDTFTQRLAWLMDEGKLPSSAEMDHTPWTSYESRSPVIMTPKEEGAA